MTLIPDEDGTTVISGMVADQAALHGLLRRLGDLGLPLVSVTRTRSSDADPPTSTHRPIPREGARHEHRQHPTGPRATRLSYIVAGRPADKHRGSLV